MLTYGFFDSVNGDRVYNAEQMSNYFKGLITDGVYQSIGSAFQVLAGSGMTVTIGTGRAVIDSRWVNNDSIATLDISPASSVYPRYTNIVLRLDTSNRRIELATVDGVPSSTPVAPEPTRTGGIYELVLARVIVITGATAIPQTSIFDTRANSELCGWVTSLIQTIDTEGLFLQWTAKYNEQFEAFKTAYDAWFDNLTQELIVGTYIEKYTKTVTGSSSIPLDMTGYTYAADDVIFVFKNGLKLTDMDWVYYNGNINLWDTVESDSVIEIVVLKSKIGMNS